MRIRWTDGAVTDLTRICDYVEEHAGAETARRIALSGHQQIEALEAFPESGRTGRRPDTRELVLSRFPYIVIYRIHDNSVEILRVLHGAQRWP
jgi:toxin ParE1/3/4